jgi:hypothetical protein
MEVTESSETPVNIRKITWCQNPKDHNLKLKETSKLCILSFGMGREQLQLIRIQDGAKYLSTDPRFYLSKLRVHSKSIKHALTM